MSALEEIIAQAIADSFYGMEAGEPPASPVEANAGDKQLAFDVTRALEAASGGPDHIVHVKGSEWVIQHPLDERFESGAASGLFNCEITQLVAAAYRVDGTFRVWLDRQTLLWEEVTP
jgi:hypothetical protein